SFRQLGFGTKENLSSGLKDIVFKVIMRKRDIKSYEHKGNMIITDLFNFYNSDNNIEFISPQLYRTLPEEKINNEINPLYQKDKERAIVDYISGMMDTFAIREWETHCRK
ncbi:TPA: deoxyguanosinetriphosphate triphosphohydrolase, partial [Klebsiella pneumoniae]